MTLDVGAEALLLLEDFPGKMVAEEHLSLIEYIRSLVAVSP